jgi:hypothetical protein
MDSLSIIAKMPSVTPTCTVDAAVMNPVVLVRETEIVEDDNVGLQSVHLRERALAPVERILSTAIVRGIPLLQLALLAPGVEGIDWSVRVIFDAVVFADHLHCQSAIE